jgi:hypothetical protein
MKRVRRVVVCGVRRGNGIACGRRDSDVYGFAGRAAVVAIALLAAGFMCWPRVDAELKVLLLLRSGLVAMVITVMMYVGCM